MNEVVLDEVHSDVAVHLVVVELHPHALQKCLEYLCCNHTVNDAY